METELVVSLQDGLVLSRSVCCRSIPVSGVTQLSESVEAFRAMLYGG